MERISRRIGIIPMGCNFFSSGRASLGAGSGSSPDRDDLTRWDPFTSSTRARNISFLPACTNSGWAFGPAIFVPVQPHHLCRQPRGSGDPARIAANDLMATAARSSVLNPDTFPAETTMVARSSLQCAFSAASTVAPTDAQAALNLWNSGSTICRNLQKMNASLLFAPFNFRPALAVCGSRADRR
jgi:hypothetical protein